MLYVSRAGEKLKHALLENNFSLKNLVCADFGSNAGGFVDCMLQFGAKKVFAIETGYGLLDWKLRTDPKVIVLERTNGMHVLLEEKVDFASVDTSWTKLENIIPNVLNNLSKNAYIIALIKPHYEADDYMRIKGKVKDEYISDILDKVKFKLEKMGLDVLSLTESPILGEKGKNREFLIFMQKGG